LCAWSQEEARIALIGVEGGVWVGGDERSIHFLNWSDGAGSTTARPIWARYMLKVYADNSLPYKKGFFKMPAKLDMRLECDPPQDLTETRPE
jgi:membrane carboxypeptidase/penicillin-binding protein